MIDEKQLQEWQGIANELRGEIAGLLSEGSPIDDCYEELLCEAIPALIAEVRRMRDDNKMMENALHIDMSYVCEKCETLITIGSFCPCEDLKKLHEAKIRA